MFYSFYQNECDPCVTLFFHGLRRYLGGGRGPKLFMGLMSLIFFAWDTHWVNLIGLSPGIDACTRGGSLCCCTCVVWRSVCFSDYKKSSMSFHYKPTPLIMECASIQSLLWLPSPEILPSTAQTSKIHPSSTLLITCILPRFDCASFWDDIPCMLCSSCVIWTYSCHKWIYTWKKHFMMVLSRCQP